MEYHNITSVAHDLQNSNSNREYFCSKCGYRFGEMSPASSQLIDINGCPGAKVHKESIPSPFWVNGEISYGDAGHTGLIEDLQAIVRSAEQYAFHDHKNKKYDHPKEALLQLLDKIMDRIENGYYDNKNI